MAWRALILPRIARSQAKTASAALFSCGASGVQEEGPDGKPLPVRQPWDEGPTPRPSNKLQLRAWLEDPDEAALTARLGELLGQDVARTAVWEDVVEVDWENDWKKGFAPIDLGRLVVAPPWDAPPGALIVEPGQAFGTGAHPTTLNALRLLVPLVTPGQTALDVGCGSGILALAAAKLGATVWGTDIDPIAVEEADRQAATNGLRGEFSQRVPESFAEPFDIVLANLFAEVLVEMSPELVRLTRHHLILAGILADREHKVRAAFDPALPLVDRVVDGEWVTLRYERA